MTKKSALVICPGRGTYNASELGYLHRHHGNRPTLLSTLDEVRAEAGQGPITDLDSAAGFKMGTHGTGENASLLIYGCALGDFAAIDRERFDIVAVTGNSMGWYLALACAGALSLRDGAHLVNTMGRLMDHHGVGGQIVWPLVDGEWRLDQGRVALAQEMLAARTDDRFIAKSIDLGGMMVFAANREGLDYLKKNLPADDRFPMQLTHHAAFHSALLDHMVPMAQEAIPADVFGQSEHPMIDGTGRVWMPHAYSPDDLYRYTLETQINETYHFSKAVEVGVKEFAPDAIIVLGPGTTMGAPVAQTLIRHNWRGIAEKSQFKALQNDAPFVVSLGMDEQRPLGVA